MIEPLLIHCDGPGCPATKRETNNWWVVNTSQTFSSSLYVLPWHSAGDAEIKAGKHACSRGCVHKILEAWLDEMEKPAAVSA